MGFFPGRMSVSFSSYTQTMCCGTGKESPELPWCAVSSSCEEQLLEEMAEHGLRHVISHQTDSSAAM